MQAVLYHHGCPHSRKLLSLENRTRLAALRLLAAAHEQLAIALQMIDAIDLQLDPFDLSLCDYARKQIGCRALTEEIYGIGELTSVTILAELVERAEIGAGQPGSGAPVVDPPVVRPELVDEAVGRAVGRRRVRQALRMPSDRRISDGVIDELLAGASTEEEIAGPGGLLAELGAWWSGRWRSS